MFIKNWSLRNVQIKLIKIGARLVPPRPAAGVPIG